MPVAATECGAGHGSSPSLSASCWNHTIWIPGFCRQIADAEQSTSPKIGLCPEIVYKIWTINLSEP
jgi:hypothetical protein